MSEVRSQLDPGKPTFVFITGRKGSGKSELAWRLWSSYPYDRLMVDVTGDIGRKHPDPDTTDITAPLPIRWPSMGDGRTSLRWQPDPGSPTYRDDLDRAVGLALHRRRCLLWLDEIDEVAHVNQVGPNMRRALHQGRHYDLSMLMCGPRPINVDPLCVGNADYVYVFKLKNVADRRRIADNIGWDHKDFDAAALGLKKHHYLRYDAEADDEELQLVEFPPLPVERRPLPPRNASSLRAINS